MTSPAGSGKRVIIVTGASRGLGRAIALRFGRARGRVVVNFRTRADDANAVAREIERSGGEALACCADVRKPSEVDRMVDETVGRWGTVDVLVNNAGLARDSLALRMSEEDWDDVVGTNLSGPFHCIRAVSRIMVKKHSGHILSMASIVGVQGRAGQANYAASKAGLIGLTKSIAKELGNFNIQANAVLPGYLATDMGGMVSDSMKDWIRKENALGRLSDQDEVADFVHHLSLMKNVSGQVFNLDSRVL